MTATEISTVPLAGGDLLASGNPDCPSVVNRSLGSRGEECSEGKTVKTNSQTDTGGEWQRPTRRVPMLRSKMALSQDSFALLEKWDGIVIGVDEDTFAARLYRAGEAGRTMQAVFSKSELSSEERGQIADGAAFVWTIGYRNIGSTRHRDSVIYFRRLPTWEDQEVDSGKRRGAELTDSIGWK
jgi:hypothetical protein